MSQQQDFKRRLIISVFHRLLKEKIQRNTILTMQYIGNATIVPAELKEERRTLLCLKKAIDSPQLSTSMGERLNMWLDTFVDLNDRRFEMAMAPHKFVPRLNSLASSIPSTALHSSLSPTSCLSPDGAGDTAVDSNPIPKFKIIICPTISKDKTEGDYARNSKLLAEFGEKIPFRG
jgi:hypothetical protein